MQRRASCRERAASTASVEHRAQSTEHRARPDGGAVEDMPGAVRSGHRGHAANTTVRHAIRATPTDRDGGVQG